jgi:hypothetical protein
MFTHRAYNGWIRDIATAPMPRGDWPWIQVDEQLERDFRETITMMDEVGLTVITVWGCFVTREWPSNLALADRPERRRFLETLKDLTESKGIRLTAGVGLYSWGFEQIIRENPHLSRGNPQALCASLEESWEWQRQVIDFVMSFPLDGVQFQSADQGRCPCGDCAQWGDVEYHVRINQRAAQYVKDNWPTAIVGINNWNLTFEREEDLRYFGALTAPDYLIDTHDSTRRVDPTYRSRLARVAPPHFGTVGGPTVEPPQHTPRDQWFLPTPRRLVENIRSLHDDGGSAVESYMRILANPGDEVSIRVAAAAQVDLESDADTLISNAVEELYRPRTAGALSELIDIFVGAEDAYFNRAENLGPTRTHPIIQIEDLFATEPGEQLHATAHMAAGTVLSYRNELESLSQRADRLGTQFEDCARLANLQRCIAGAVSGIDRAATKGH